MSHSLLYQCLGVNGYHHLRGWSSRGVTYWKVVAHVMPMVSLTIFSSVFQQPKWRELIIE